MKLLTSLALTVPLMASSAYGHYIFQFLTANGVRGSQYQYIRPNTNYNSPVTDLNSADLRCNVGGGSGGSTATVEVRAGSSISFHSDTAVYHQGPTSIYMSRAPSTAASYDGSGQWFKIREWGATGGCSSWTLSNTYTFNLPSSLPNGEYLLRIEQLAVHNPWPAGIPQFYISCAQIRVTGGGSGSPNPTVSIPGHVRQSDPGYTANIYNQCSSYTVPGPRPWSG